MPPYKSFPKNKLKSQKMLRVLFAKPHFMLFRPKFRARKNLNPVPNHHFLSTSFQYPLKGVEVVGAVLVGGVRAISGSVMSSASAAREQLAPGNEVQEVKMKVLAAENDDHGGVIVEMKEAMDSEAFVSLLRASIAHWRQQGKKGVWIKMPIELANLVEAAVKEGFWYHHAERKHLMLVYWIPEGPNTIPPNATHRVGVGAFVLNEKGEVLVVQENSGKFRGSGVWKFPTGVVEEGEDICDAAVREVKEETGIDSKFVEVLAFRQSHKSFFEKSDLFFLCMLQPLSFDTQKQESEIEAVQWMPIEEYAAQPFVQTQGLLRNLMDVCLAKKDGVYSGFSPVPTTSSFSNEESYLYLNGGCLKSE